MKKKLKNKDVEAMIDHLSLMAQAENLNRSKGQELLDSLLDGVDDTCLKAREEYNHRSGIRQNVILSFSCLAIGLFILFASQFSDGKCRYVYDKELIGHSLPIETLDEFFTV